MTATTQPRTRWQMSTALMEQGLSAEFAEQCVQYLLESNLVTPCDLNDDDELLFVPRHVYRTVYLIVRGGE